MTKKREKNIAYTFVGAILLASILFSGSIIFQTHQEDKLRNAKVDVLKDWKISIDDNRTYQPGDVITINSIFKKLINVKGESHRYFQCYKPGTKDWDSYIEANRNSGTAVPTNNGRSAYTVVVPLNLGKLPNTCRIYVITTYNVDEYHRAFQEIAYTNSFTVMPRQGIVNNNSETLIYTDNPDIKQYNSSYTPPNTSQPIVIYKDNVSNPTLEDSPEVPKSSLVPRTINNLLDKVGL
jgi:hypothetical protein